MTWTNRETGASERKRIAHVFSMIGAVPNADWLDGRLARDDKGFVKTGPAATQAAETPEGHADRDGATCGAGRWPLGRPPSLFETSRPGVFAVGDVRADSVKRVASAVGEGSVCVQFLHGVLAEQGAGPRRAGCAGRVRSATAGSAHFPERRASHTAGRAGPTRTPRPAPRPTPPASAARASARPGRRRAAARRRG